MGDENPGRPKKSSRQSHVHVPTSTKTRGKKSGSGGSRSVGPCLSAQFQGWIAAFPSPTEFLVYFTKKLNHYKSSNSKSRLLLDSIHENSLRHLDSVQKVHEKDDAHFKLQSSLDLATTQLAQERGNYLQLVHENERLESELEDYKHKFQVVLLLSNTKEQDVSYYIQNNPRAPQLTDQMIKIRHQIQQVCGEKGTEMLNPLTLWKEKEILRSQLESQSQFYHSQILQLQQNLGLVREERGLRIEQLNARLKSVMHKLRYQNDLLQTVLVENIDLQKRSIEFETEWNDERSKLLDLISIETVGGLGSGNNGFESQALAGHLTSKLKTHAQVQGLKQELARTQNKLLETESRLESGEWTILKLEKEKARTHVWLNSRKDEHEAQVSKLIQRNELLERRLGELESRRKLDNQGFHEDFKKLRKFLQCLENKLKAMTMPKLPQPLTHGLPARSKSAPESGEPPVSRRHMDLNKETEKKLSERNGNGPVFPDEILKLLQVASLKLDTLEAKYQKLS